MNIQENNSQLKTNSRLMWLSIASLSLSTYTIVTADFAPIGLMTLMAKGLQKSESMIGLTVTLYSWIGGISGLLTVIFLGNVPKKNLLLSSVLIMLISNVLSALSTDYSMLLVARVIGGVANGALWALVFVVAMLLVPKSKIGLATSIVFGGVTAGNILGVPSSSFIGNKLAWPMAFWMISGLSLLTLFGILILVPNIKNSTVVDMKAFKKVMSNRTLLKVYMATLVTVGSYFCAFTFIVPYLHSSRFISDDLISMMLFIFGVAGLLGNLLTGIFVDKHLKLIVLFSTAFISITLLILGFFSESLGQVNTIMLISLWGLSISGIFVGFQTWLLRTDPANAFPASAIYSTIFNVSMGLGALLGAWLLAKFDTSLLMASSGVAIAFSLLLISTIPDRFAFKK